jgi:ABC-type bacteriocin/lantibiotic exporter with double-glycine peptidase domain
MKQIRKKINGFIFHLVLSGVITLLLGIMIVWTDFLLRLVVGLFIIVIAYSFFYGAYKIWWLKKEVEKHFKL